MLILLLLPVLLTTLIGGEYQFPQISCFDIYVVIMFQELRQELDYVLDSRITNSKDSNWDPKSKEGAILRAIIDLVTTEDASNNFESRQR